MRKLQCLLFLLKRSYICYHVICMTYNVNLLLLLPDNSSSLNFVHMILEDEKFGFEEAYMELFRHHPKEIVARYTCIRK